MFDVSQQIHAQKDELTRARLFLLTDGLVRKVDVEPISVNGLEIEHHLWDLEKLFRFITSHMQREVIQVDFVKDFGGAIPCLGAPEVTTEYQTYLAFFPGDLLAKLYGKYGPRLLEKNVRAFLQAKGKINRGIRKTILEEPEHFLAFNNGISATAERVEFEEPEKGVSRLKSARDFQIVNGGQTTASIYQALKRDEAVLTNLVVQVKLTVLNDPSKVELFVPLISRYANSQNKVNAADFSANHPYHVTLEEISRRLWAPPVTGTTLQTHWYYERARGSYLDEKGRAGTPSQKKSFEAKNPLRQKFTKTDLAKYEHTWDQYPHYVCRGAEKNFNKLTETFVENGYPAVDEDYFCRLVAKAILFKTAEKIVGAQDYGGFRANIVTYSLAWLSHHTSQRIDLDRVWKEQQLTENLCKFIEVVSKHAYEHIVTPPTSHRNPGEWSKQEECWKQFCGKNIKIPRGLEDELVDTSRPDYSRQTTRDLEGAPLPDTESAQEISQLVPVPAETWFKLSHWAKETNNLKPWQRGLAFSMGKLAKRGRPPSSKQANQALKILEEANRKGFRAKE